MKLTVTDSHPLLDRYEQLSRLAGCEKKFGLIARSGYWQLQKATEDPAKAAYVTQKGAFPA